MKYVLAFRRPLEHIFRNLNQRRYLGKIVGQLLNSVWRIFDHARDGLGQATCEEGHEETMDH